jgi:lipid-binding SYLF domain-containing protein
MNTMLRHSFALATLLLVAAGCQTTPTTESGKDWVLEQSQSVIDRFSAEDPGFRDVLHRSYGHAVFPRAGKGGFIVGGAYGRGAVYEQNRMIGWADIAQATVGAQVGGQTFDEVVIFENRDALERFKNNQLTFAANASAVAIKKGTAAAARYENGVIVFVDPRQGGMVEASVGGQKFTFKASDTATTRPADRDGDVRIETKTETREKI